ncbi:hypothetical protein WISP_98843 [Willisornis vidua]|uniref:SUEL-type lectin domain-containing protein n=1 Tax=Willisornis vidua TaxID=1566151 RepID=A0ABQ9CZA1_9PASS|nr:hypothetical protein WISP_98843 [Willisornis vidua]
MTRLEQTSVFGQGLVLGLALFNIFVGDIDSGTEYTLTKFVNDIKLCGAVDTLEGKDANQSNPDRLERWSSSILWCIPLVNEILTDLHHVQEETEAGTQCHGLVDKVVISQSSTFSPGSLELLTVDAEMEDRTPEVSWHVWDCECQQTDEVSAKLALKKVVMYWEDGECEEAEHLAGVKGYISQVLKNYTDHACDGEYVSLRCPHRTTISIQSSFYGRIVPSHQMCPSRYSHSYATLIKEDVACSVGTSLQKMLDECQDRRSCQFLVNSRLFGTDPCPGTGKYLIVWYKCRPNEYKSKVACEDDKLRLSCKKSMVIAIYSAIFGRTQGGSLECPYQNLGMPMIGKQGNGLAENTELDRVISFTVMVVLAQILIREAGLGHKTCHGGGSECQSATALQLMIKRCHGKSSCSIYASTYEFGDPCYPGIQKHLNVIYTCEIMGPCAEIDPVTGLMLVLSVWTNA